MSEEWLIDGYNVLHAFSRMRGGDRKISKGALFAELAGFAAGQDRKVIVVLDGKGSDEELKGFQTPVFEVRYSQAVSADSAIEKYLYENRQKKLMVVTNDRAIAQITRGVGARVTSAEGLLELLRAQSKEDKGILHKRQTDAHRFHRPFEKKLEKFK
ncbi:MAG: NYN domain-containing protein [Candidatus Omnitrophota bacterium]